MSTTHAGSTETAALEGSTVSLGRTRATRLIAGFMATSAILFGAVAVAFTLVAESQQVHRFHNAVVASLLLVLTAPAAVAVARRPEQSQPGLMMLTALSIAAALTMVASLTADPFTLPFVILTAVLWAVRPTRLAHPRSLRPSPVLLSLVLTASVPLITYAFGQAELQRTLAANEHSDFFHWVETSFYAAGIVAVGLLAGVHPGRYRLAAISSGLALSTFGAASLAFSHYVSAVSAPWAWTALVGGAAVVAVGRWESQRHLIQARVDPSSHGKTPR